jgi:predicted transcriptional regulator
MYKNFKVGDLVVIDLYNAFEGMPVNDNDENIGIIMDIHKDINREYSFGVQIGNVFEYFEASSILSLK